MANRPDRPDFVLDDEKICYDDAKLIHGELRTFDVGLALVAQDHLKEPETSAEESVKLRRKIDWHLLPLLCLVYTGEPLSHWDRFCDVDDLL